MPTSDDKWRSDTLDQVFVALATSDELSQKLIYKGARVLRLRLNEHVRASFDIDATFAVNLRDDQEKLEQVRKLAHDACVAYFEGQATVRYTLRNSRIRRRRQSGPHPRGWDVYWLDLEVDDLSRASRSQAKTPLRIDIAAPERLSDYSTSPAVLNDHSITAITLERIAGEKLRAFLTCLPTYRKKIREKTAVSRRVKDLYDLARIMRRRPVSDTGFWGIAAREFVLACESRLVDCHSMETFREDWEGTREAFVNDVNIPNDVSFGKAESTLEQAVASLSDAGVLPLKFDLLDAD